MVNDDVSELAIKIMESIAYDGPLPLAVTAQDMEMLSEYELNVLNKALGKAIAKGLRGIEYAPSTDTVTIFKP